jgi:hypothetical protein
VLASLNSFDMCCYLHKDVILFLIKVVQFRVLLLQEIHDVQLHVVGGWIMLVVCGGMFNDLS